MCRYGYVTKIKVVIVLCLALAACSNGGTGVGKGNYTIQIIAIGANLGSGSAKMTVTETDSHQLASFDGTSASAPIPGVFYAGQPYSLSISNPTAPAQTCTPNAGSPPLSGTVSGNLTFTITCNIVRVNVSGSVIGYTGTGLVLQITNGSPATETITAATGPNFSFKVPSGSNWAISAAAQPTGPAETCTGPSSTQPVGSSDIVDLVVTCTPVPFNVTVTVINLLGSGLSLVDVPSGAPMSVNQNGPFTITFPPIPAGSSYSVAQVGKVTNPSQTCGPTPGTTASANAINSDVQVSFTCTTTSYPISFTLSGSNGLGLQATLLVNGSPFSSYLVSSNTCVPNSGNATSCNPTSSPPSQYTFPQNAPSGANYKIVVTAQNDSTQNCYVWNVGGSGQLSAASPPNATIVCNNVASHALTLGQGQGQDIGEGAAALYDIQSGFLTYAQGDPALFANAVPPVSSSPGTLAVPGSVLGGTFLVAQADGSITSYSFYQTSTENNASTSISGIPLAMLYDENTSTLTVCYLVPSENSLSLYFQAYTYSFGYEQPINAIGSPTLLTSSAFGGNCSLLKSTGLPNTYVYAYYGIQNGGDYPFYLHGFNLGPAFPIVPPTTLIDLGAQFVASESAAEDSLVLNDPSIDPLGRFLYILSNVGCPYPVENCVYQIGFSIAPGTGHLTAIPSTGPLLSSTSQQADSALLYEPSGTFAYIPYGQNIVPFSIDSTSGVLTDTLNNIPLIPSSVGAAASTASIDPSGTFLVIDSAGSNSTGGSGGNSTVFSYTISPTNGSLTELAPIPVSGTPVSQPIFDPSGKYVYFPTSTTGTTAPEFISYLAYSVAPSGLQSISGAQGAITNFTPTPPYSLVLE